VGGVDGTEERGDVNVTYCVDVGSVAGGNFAWARVTDDAYGSGAEHDSGGSDAVTELRNRIRADLSDAERAVSIGFESPLFLPLRGTPARLTSVRGAFEHSSFAGGPGSAVLVTGLMQVAFLLDGLGDRVTTSHTVFDADRTRRLFVWEAFVSGMTEPAPICVGGQHSVHACDAILAATAAHDWLAGRQHPWAHVRGPRDFVDVERCLDLVCAAVGRPAIVSDLVQWHAAIVQTAKPRDHRMTSS
jgi:hypothetical protein